MSIKLLGTFFLNGAFSFTSNTNPSLKQLAEPFK